MFMFVPYARFYPPPPKPSTHNPATSTGYEVKVGFGHDMHCIGTLYVCAIWLPNKSYMCMLVFLGCEIIMT